jgi:hypothetical protein
MADVVDPKTGLPVYTTGDKGPTKSIADVPNTSGGLSGFNTTKESLSEQIDKITEDTAFSWIDNLHAILKTELEASAQAIGETKQYGDQLLDSQWSAFLQQADKELFQRQPSAMSTIGSLVFRPTDAPQDWYMKGKGFQALTNYARLYFQAQAPELRPAWETILGNQKALTPPSGGGGSGGGAVGGSLEGQIRSSFDVSQLAAEAQNLYRGLMFDDLQDPRALAREYIDKIVATGGAQKYDFDTFVTDKIMESPRAAALYSNKPLGMSPQDYMQPYLQSAQAVLGGTQEAVDTAVAGARLGASSSAFQARLARTDANTGSAPFINQLGARLNDLKGVFKG